MRGSKESYSSKQKRMARHIEDSQKEQGASSKDAGRIAWATVNKKTGGAKGKKTRSTGGRSGNSRRRTVRKTTRH